MRILILDDHPVIADSISQYLTSILPKAEIFNISSVQSAQKTLLNNIIDFVICDLELNQGANLVIPEHCHQDKIPFMVFSSHVNKILVQQLLKLRVKCYVSKTSGVDAMKIGLDNLLMKKNYYCPLVSLTMSSDEEIKETDRLTLSNPQKKILDLLSKGFTRTEIATKLCKSKTTINNHLAMAREKNGCHSTDELIRRNKFWDSFD